MSIDNTVSKLITLLIVLTRSSLSDIRKIINWIKIHYFQNTYFLFLIPHMSSISWLGCPPFPEHYQSRWHPKCFLPESGHFPRTIPPGHPPRTLTPGLLPPRHSSRTITPRIFPTDGTSWSWSNVNGDKSDVMTSFGMIDWSDACRVFRKAGSSFHETISKCNVQFSISSPIKW
jgi:hypothetical protein